ncbi:MAG TPA: hypothetical protein VJ044_18660 [Candidatus Hodarchaeales archaeon]|nr:hypothetical protein [Candidatus Hodarchaeales archaeon]
MSIVVKDVEKDVYARFKARAVQRGMKIGAAVTEAMKKWLEDIPIDILTSQNQANNDAYRRLIGSLRKSHSEKWGVISQGDLVGVFDDKSAALSVINERPQIPNLLFRISLEQSPLIVNLGSSSLRIHRKATNYAKIN